MQESALVPPSPRPAGFSLVELLIGLALSSLVAVGAYRFLTQNTRTSSSAIREARVHQEINKFVQKFLNEISNAIAIPGGSGTALANLQPASCGSERFPSGLVPFPGYMRDSIPTNLTAIDPSAVTVTSDSSDALRLVYFPRESASIPVKDPVTGFDAIVTDLLDQTTIRTGDYAVISDGSVIDLFRVTALSASSGQVQISHDASSSAWNLPLDHKYVPVSGPVFVHKVNVVTYAVHTDDTVYYDNHAADDGFNVHTGQFPTLPAPGLARSWVPVAPHIRQMQIYFERNEPDGTRAPVAGPSAPDDPACKNMIGYPLLTHVRVELKTDLENERKATPYKAVPENLIHGQMANLYESLATEEVILTPNPTATPGGPTPTPWPTATPGPTATPAGPTGESGGS